MKNNNLKDILENSMGKYYRASNKLTVYRLPPYKILNFPDLQNGDKLKNEIEDYYYQKDFKLSDKIIMNKKRYENKALFNDDLHSGMTLEDIKSTKKYEAFSNLQIIPDLYHLNAKEEESVLSFVNKYGLLEADYKYKNYYKRTKVLGTSNYSIFPVFEDYNILIKNIELLQNLIQLWIDIKNNAINKNNNNLLQIWNIEFGHVPRSSPFHLKNAEENEIKIVAKEFLKSFCNEGLQTASPILKANNEFEVNYTSTNLLGVLYVQLYKIILNQRNSYTCDYCGKLNFYNTKGNSNKFCQPSDKTGHSDCNNNYNNMRRLARYKIIKNKYNFKQIKKYAKTIKWTDFKGEDKKGRELKEILEWIYDYDPRPGKWENALKEYKKNKPETFKKIKKYLNNK